MYDEKQCKFAKSHEWAFGEGDVAVVGISDHAQKEISDIVFVELPKAGATVEQGKACAVIESVKAAADFYAPVSGEVIEVNDAIAENPALVNQSPHMLDLLTWLMDNDEDTLQPLRRDLAGGRWVVCAGSGFVTLPAGVRGTGKAQSFSAAARLP